MDSSTGNWTTAENKAFEEALAEVDLNSSDWLEQLTTRFPNKTAEQLRAHCMNLVVDIESMEARHFPYPIHKDSWAVKVTTETEDLSMLDLHYFPEFSWTGSASVPKEKVEEEDSLLPVNREAKAMLSEEIMRGNFVVPTNKGLMKESLHEQVMGQDIVNPEIEEGLGENEVLSLEIKQKEKVLPEAGTKVEGGKKDLRVMTGVAVEKWMDEELETPASRKGKLWTEEEHRLFLLGLHIHGRGAWSKIAKNFVHTRTPTQVASHAQKFFNRHLDQRQRHRRHSILDITNPHRASMYNSVNGNIQNNLNNANCPVHHPGHPKNNDHQFSRLPLPNNLGQKRSSRALGDGDHPFQH